MPPLLHARPLSSAHLRRILQKRFRLSKFERYAGAFAIVAGGALVRLVLLEALGTRLAYLTLYPAVMLAAFIGGFGPGVFSAVVAAGSVVLFWTDTPGFLSQTPVEWLGTAIFLASSVMMAGIAEVSRRSRYREEERSSALSVANERLTQEVQRRQEAEQRLRLNDERFRLAAFSDEITLYEQDAELRYTWLYPEHAELRTAIGRTDVEILGAVEGEPLRLRKMAVMKTGLSDRVEVRATMPNGVRYYDTFISPRRAEDQTIIGVAGTALDITSRKRAEENRSRLAAIVEFSDDAIIAKDLNGIVTSWNQGATRIFGYNADEILGKPVSVLVPPDRMEEEPDILDRIRRGERIDHFETRRSRKDGSPVEISMSISPVRNDVGEVEGASTIAREITDRVRAEHTTQFLAVLNERLAEVSIAEDMIRLASEITGRHLGAQRCYFSEWDEATGRLTVTEDWSRSGESLPSLAGLYQLPEFGPPEWRQQLAAGLLVEDVERHPALKEFLGSYRTVGVRSYIASGFLRKGPSVISLVATSDQPRHWRRDEMDLLRRVAEKVWPLAERARSERALRRSERQLRLITDNAPVLLAHLDRDHRFKFVNQTYARVYGREVKDIVGAHLSEVAATEVYAASRHHLDLAFAGQRVEFEMQIKAGEVEWVHVIYTPEESVTGEIVGVMALLTDITARKRTEYEIGLARDQAVAASRAKDEFLAALSHELRTPLNPVLLVASEAADNPDLPAEVRRDFATIRKNVELEARLIDDLLDLTRITRGKLPLDQKNVNGETVLLDALAVVRADVDEKKIRLTVDFGAKEAGLFVDAVRLQQIYWNVLKNAVKFTPPGGSVHVRTKTSQQDGKFIVTIQDTGIGMTPAELSRVFNAFAQGDHAGGGGSHRFGGIGLGLTISRMLAERQGGTLNATSSGPGQGSTFMIELPLASAPALDADGAGRSSPVESSDPARRVSSRRVLVVEDHAPTREAVAGLLRRRNYDVLTAASLHEARTRVKEGGVRLLVSDIGLPDGDGCELMAELRDGMGLRGIALTGYGMEADIARSAKAGFLAHLTKPIRVQALDAALSAAWRSIEPSRS